jgi:hypothetical protein
MSESSEITSHPMARIKRIAPKPAFFPGSITFTPEIEEILQGFSQDAKDFTGRAVGRSAILRALVRYASRQGKQWLRDQIFPLVEEELNAGIMWGKKK